MIIYDKKVFFALFSVFFFVVFSNTLPLMAGIYIISDLGGSNYISIYAVSFFSVGNALGVPLGIYFSKRVGTVRFLIICLVLFALFSLACAHAANFPLFIIFRLLSGIVSGPFFVLTFKLFGALTPPEKKLRFSSILLTMFVVVPTLGVTWGGWIAYYYHWRLVFYYDFPFILFLAFFIGYKLKGFDPPPKKISYDWVGYFFYFISILSISTVLIMGQELDWFRSPLINLLSVIGVLSGTFFVLWEIYSPEPLLDLKFLKKSVFVFALLNLALLFSVYFGMTILLSLWLHLYVNYTPVWIGFLIGIMAVAGLLPKPLLEHRLSEFDCRIPLALAILFLAISSFYTMFFNVDIDMGRIAISRFLAGFGLAFFLPPIFRLCFHSFPEEDTPQVLVFFQLVRGLASGLGAALYVILWQRRQVFYHERLGSKLTVFSEQTQHFFSKAQEFYLQGNRANAQLEVYLDRQSTALALDDCFYLMGWIMVGLLVINGLSLFLKKEQFCPGNRGSTAESTGDVKRI